MSELKTFNLIKDFVADLWTCFETNKPTPLSLYNRLINGIKDEETDRILKVNKGYVDFFANHLSVVESGDLTKLPEGTTINIEGSTKVFLQLTYYISKCDQETMLSIAKHLLVIATSLEQDIEKQKELKEKFANLERSNVSSSATEFLLQKCKLDDSSEEGKFFAGLIENVTNSMKDVDLSNPLSAITGLMANGGLNNIMESFTSTGGANKDPKKMMKVIKKMINNILPDDEDETTTLNVENSAANTAEKTE